MEFKDGQFSVNIKRVQVLQHITALQKIIRVFLSQT